MPTIELPLQPDIVITDDPSFGPEGTEMDLRRDEAIRHWRAPQKLWATEPITEPFPRDERWLAPAYHVIVTYFDVGRLRADPFEFDD